MIQDNVKLSFSSLDTYSVCPFRYRELYIRYKKEPASKYLLYGSAFHNLLDTLYSEEKFSLDIASQLWPKILDKEMLKKKYSKLARKEMLEAISNGKRDIIVFFELARRENLLHPCIEHEFELEGKYRKHILKAKIDLITNIRGGIGILDWKTGNPDKKALMQLALYAAFYSKKTNQTIDWICPVYFRTKEVIYQPFDKDIQEEAGEYFSRIYEEFIKDIDFLPKENKYCRTCSFKNLTCPLYKKIV